MRSSRSRRFSRRCGSALAALILALPPLGCGSGNDRTSLQTSAGSDKILHGTAADAATFPQMVQLTFYRYAEDVTSMGLCSGTVIAPTKILTAAHCVERPFDIATVISPLIGETSIVSVAVHPLRLQSTEDLNYKDVAIVTTSEPLPLPALGIFSSAALLPGAGIGIYGYGLDDDGLAGVLRTGAMTLDAITADRLYAVYREEQSNTCFGDSGGAATFARVTADGVVDAVGIVGITEAGTSEDCGVGETTSFTSLQEPSVLDFIRSEAPEAVIF